MTFSDGLIPKAHGKQRVMLVDNDTGSANAVAWTLTQNHFAIEHFSEPGEALKEFKKNQGLYKVIIVDARMRGMTCFEFARRIRKLCSKVRIVLLTDFQISKSEFAKVFPSSQIDDIVVKPTEPGKLIKSVTGLDNSKSSDPVSGVAQQGLSEHC